MILVDTDVLIASTRGVKAAESWLIRAAEVQGGLAISVLTITEITGGIRTGERREIRRLLASLTKLDVDERVAWRAGEYQRTYRRSHSHIALADYILAATADMHGLELATLNVKHFPMFEDLAPPFNTARD